ncbi:unnamed protein product, partial [Hapterophycus canaliculatus]
AFDQAWIETAGLREDYVPHEYHAEATYRDSRRGHYHPAVATDVPAPGAVLRDGYYTATQSSTRTVSSDYPAQEVAQTRRDDSNHSMVSDSLIARHGSAAMSEVAEVPFFLTVDSPIDTAPSIDAVAAQRLRRIGISHITHLMNQDSNRLADTLGLAGVDAKTIRRWQSECRLMCRVPQLRAFDARVLVGCGISDPAKLAAIHPTDLLDRVKTFLATERGQQILLSGTSYELSRITSWIASANHSIQTVKRTRTVDGRPVATRVTRQRNVSLERDDHREETYLTDDDFDRKRYEGEVERRADRIADEIDELTRDYDSSGSSHNGRSNGRNSSSTRGSSGTRSSSSSRTSSGSDRSSSESGRTSSSNGLSSNGHSSNRESNGDGIVRRTVSGLRGSSSSESRSRRSERNGQSNSSSRRNRSDRDRFGVGDDVAQNITTTSAAEIHRNQEFFIGYDVRAELGYQLTSMIHVRGGVQLIDLA